MNLLIQTIATNFYQVINVFSSIYNKQNLFSGFQIK